MDTLRATPTILLLFASLFSGTGASAGEISAVLNGKSYHVGSTQKWNEANYGLGLEYQFASTSRWRTRLMANGFRDSNYDMSYMAGAGLHRNLISTSRLDDFYLDVGINAFVMTRHDVRDNRPFPGALPSVTLGNRYGGFNVTYLPMKAVESMFDSNMVDESISGIFFLQFKFVLGGESSGDNRYSQGDD